MKKVITLCAAVLMNMAVMAQVDETFQFVDANGTVVPDGSVITVSVVEDDGFGSLEMKVPLFLRNSSGQETAVGIYETIDDMPNGMWQTCVLGNCVSLTKTGYSSKAVVAGDQPDMDLQTEWFPEGGQYATWQATLQIHIFNVESKESFGQNVKTVGDQVTAYGPQVTVRFQYADPASVSQLRADGSAVREVYDLQGRLSGCSAGLRIVRRADGTVGKVLQR